jgi:hypothetical protein
MTYNLEAHVEGIGLTGWDWQRRVSKWVGFDFDAISGHAEGHRGKLTDEELAEVKRKAKEIPWVTVRTSTSGKGIHLYVFLPDVPTANHTEHAALARAILGQMSALVGFDFKAKVDACGGILWVYHRKQRGTDGLTLHKQGVTLIDVPNDWRDNLDVVVGKRRRTMPQVIQVEDKRTDRDRLFDELTGQQRAVPLDDDHQKLIDYLRDNRLGWSWSTDHHMLQTHTASLKKAHKALGLKGPFETVSTGRDSQDINCFAFALRNGAWVVRRYGNAAEAATWTRDRNGYSRCFLNRLPDLAEAARGAGGAEHKAGGYAFPKAAHAVAAAAALGVDIEVPGKLLDRDARLLKHKDGRLVIEIDREGSDKHLDMAGWAADGKKWHQVLDARAEPRGPQEDDGDYDAVVRHLVTEGGEDAGWAVQSDGRWLEETKSNACDVLVHLGVKKSDVDAVAGGCVLRPWTLVTVPFGPEYPGDRTWNRGAARFRFPPTADRDDLHHPTWDRVLGHVGEGLDDAVKNHPWCREHGIVTGGDYLKHWVASVFQHPYWPLPYLFLYSMDQDTGKSTFHEALEQLMVNGHQRADRALTSPQGFNGELRNAVVCVVEETNLRDQRDAGNRIKDWVTSRSLPIHPKGGTPYTVPNTTHWIQCSNDRDACPIFRNDTRITMIRVKPLDPSEAVPKEELLRLLREEGPDFLAAVLALELPPPSGRLGIPIVESRDKKMVQDANRTALERFTEEICYLVDGSMISQADFWTRFQAWLDADERAGWTKTRVGHEMPVQFPKGMSRRDRQNYFGNIAWDPPAAGAPKLAKLIVKDGILVPEVPSRGGRSGTRRKSRTPVPA